MTFYIGLDYGAMGKELLYNSNSWSNQWKLIGCDVQRFVNYLFFLGNCSFVETAPFGEDRTFDRELLYV